EDGEEVGRAINEMRLEQEHSGEDDAGQRRPLAGAQSRVEMEPEEREERGAGVIAALPRQDEKRHAGREEARGDERDPPVLPRRERVSMEEQDGGEPQERPRQARGERGLSQERERPGGEVIRQPGLPAPDETVAVLRALLLREEVFPVGA